MAQLLNDQLENKAFMKFKKYSPMFSHWAILFT